MLLLPARGGETVTALIMSRPAVSVIGCTAISHHPDATAAAAVQEEEEPSALCRADSHRGRVRCK